MRCFVLILKSFCDGETSVRINLDIDFNEGEIRVEVMRNDLRTGIGDGISFDASEFSDALKYYDMLIKDGDDCD